MTIGIGVLCSTEQTKADALILISDSMGSTDTDSTNALAKMFSHGNVHGVGADNLSVASELFYAITVQIEALRVRNHGTIWKSINEAVNGIRSERFMWQVLRSEHVIANDHIGILFQDEPSKIQESWKNFYVGATLLIGTFDDDGQALLYYVGGMQDAPGLVHFMQFPGHFTIGIGSQNAEAWLNYRNQALNLGVKQSLYHAFEASVMAASAPTVNREIEITIAMKDDTSYFGKNRNYPGKYSVSFAELNAMYKKYGPQRTEGISFMESTQPSPQSTTGDPPPQPPLRASHGGSGES